MSGIKGDFTGFTYNGRHSSDLGLTVVSSSSRYNDNLTPTISSKTTNISGVHGTYFFKQVYTQQSFNISVAFDDMTEVQLRELRSWFGDNEPHELIFDERPYEVYYAIISAAPQLKYICFGNPRTYKGEGTIAMVAYFPFAKSKNKFLNQYTEFNKEEWADASKMLNDASYTIDSTTYNYDTFVHSSSGDWARIYNAGDLETPWTINVLSTLFSSTVDTDIEISLCSGQDSSTVLKTLELTVPKNNIVSNFYINSKLQILYTEVNNKKTIYNQYITTNQWFNIPLIEESDFYTIKVTVKQNNSVIDAHSYLTIDYGYLYY